MNDPTFVLTLSCIDRPGIVAAVTSRLAEIGANIAESSQFWDQQTNHFFMRIAFTAPTSTSLSTLENALKTVIDRFDISLAIADQAIAPKIIIMVSKFDHAMRHLLYQIRVGRLKAQIVAIVSNHEDARNIAQFENIAFHHLPVTKDTKQVQEHTLLELVKSLDADLVVLARYMQILSDKLSRQMHGKIINIHHSFLPSFKGAKPYHQAHERGVKLIGATAHYVTPDLDEGPIIEQDITRISHAQNPQDMVAEGREVESRVLARAVKLHLEQRVMINGHKTVVFD